MILAVGGIIVGMSLLATSVAGYMLVKYQSIDRLDDLDVPQAANGQPENYLIVAVDTREGQESLNTDTIMVVRIDPQSERVALTSLNRDLMVTIADTGDIGMINSAYSRPDGTGAQNLINTIGQNFDIAINHFIAVDFQSFQQVVDAVGGVNMYFPYPVRDKKAGLYQYDAPACVTLNGEQGLAFARSRYFQYMDAGGSWVSDGSADLGRVQRQQVFLQRALAKALSQVRSNPLRLRELVDIGVANVTLDGELTIGDMLDLAERFQDFDSDKLEAYPLPVKEYPPDPNRVLLDEAGAEEFLNVFRGIAPGEVRPGLIEVSVLNGTQGQNATLAGDTSSALQQIGFELAAPQDADDLYEQSVVLYAPGQLTYGQRVARHLTSPVELREDPDLPSGHVRVIAGLDFTTVHEDPAPLESLAPPVGAGGEPVTPTTAQAAPAPETTGTTVPSPTTTTTEPTGFVVGEPPDGQEC
jgi:LCP family protein required for cell wall assembly